MNSLDYKQICLDLGEIAKETGLLLQKQKGINVVTKQKDIGDVQTQADLLSEQLIIKYLNHKYPKINILSEESGEQSKEKDLFFLIDPLDGTKEFQRGLPFYNVSLSLILDGNAVVSVVCRPEGNQLFSAYLKGGAFLNGKKISFSKTSSLNKSMIYCYLPCYFRNSEGFDDCWKTLGELNKKIYRLRSIPDENSNCCFVGNGASDGFINTCNPPKAWDILPGLFIAKEAGCKISSIAGKKINFDMIDSIVVSNPYIYEDLLAVLNKK